MNELRTRINANIILPKFARFFDKAIHHQSMGIKQIIDITRIECSKLFVGLICILNFSDFEWRPPNVFAIDDVCHLFES